MINLPTFLSKHKFNTSGLFTPCINNKCALLGIYKAVNVLLAFYNDRKLEITLKHAKDKWVGLLSLATSYFFLPIFRGQA
jgi:hypothetical protein